MSRILEQIVADMKPALEAAKRNVPFPEMKKRAENARAPKNFVQAFQDRSRTNYIGPASVLKFCTGVSRQKQDQCYCGAEKSLAVKGADPQGFPLYGTCTRA